MSNVGSQGLEGNAGSFRFTRAGERQVEDSCPGEQVGKLFSCLSTFSIPQKMFAVGCLRVEVEKCTDLVQLSVEGLSQLYLDNLCK